MLLLGSNNIGKVDYFHNPSKKFNPDCILWSSGNSMWWKLWFGELHEDIFQKNLCDNLIYHLITGVRS